jgi:transposase InsO family protein
MITMKDDSLDSPEAIKSFLDNTDNVEFKVTKKNAYEWLGDKLKSTGYLSLRKRDKSIVREYLQRMTGYSRAQLKRLVIQYRKKGEITRSISKRQCFKNYYTRADKLLLAQTDEVHQTLSGSATRKLFERAYTIYKDPTYVRLSKISVSHLYNLRQDKIYLSKRRFFTKTQRTAVKIGTRRKPCPDGRPGFIRIDTVHQGDQDGRKGVYHINAVDEVTQYEVILSVQKISEAYLIPVLKELLRSFPFVIINFHSDNGSEYINKIVANLLNKLHIEMTKSRSRHSNDNALAESKNGCIVRKYFGYVHIDQKWAPLINKFTIKHLIPYLNFHRPCHFSETKVDARGKEKKIYPYRCIKTPYEKLKSLPGAAKYLKPEITFEILDQQMKSKTDFQAAKELKAAQAALFKKIFSSPS